MFATISNGFGRIIYELGGDSLLSSWEVLLDTTLLAASFSNVSDRRSTQRSYRATRGGCRD